MGSEHLLDARDMELPEPLLYALSELESLLPGDFLRMLSQRDPLLLYPLLEAQGFAYARGRRADGGYEILVWRSGDAAAERAARG